MSKFLDLLLILLLSVGDIYLFRVGVLPIEPSIFFIPLLVIVFYFQNGFKFQIINSNSTIFFFGILILISIIYSFNSISEDTAKTVGLHCVSLILYFYCFLYAMKASSRKILLILIVGYGILVFSIIYDLIFNGNKLVTRGAGFAENPNGAAFRLIVLGIVIFSLIDSINRKRIFAIIWMLSIFLTLSRSGMILGVLLFLVLIINNFAPNFQRQNISLTRMYKAGLILIVSGCFFVLVTGTLVTYIPGFASPAAIRRIESITGKRSLLEEDDSQGTGRINIALNYWNLIEVNPLGYGTGASYNKNLYDVSAHNLYLKIGVEYGLPAIIFLLYFMVVSARLAVTRNSSYYLLMIIAFFIFGFFSHLILENRTFIITLAFIDALSLRRYLISNRLRNLRFRFT